MSLRKVCPVLLVISILAFGHAATWAEDLARGQAAGSEVDIVCNWMYADEVGWAIDEAEESIDVAMYLVVIQSTVSWLVDKLVEAQDRGVEVRIIMDNDNDEEGADAGDDDYALTYLTGKGLDVKLDRQEKMMHSKMLIIDGRTVIVGSTNWSDNSINNNNEANARIDDTGVAGYFERFFEAAWDDASEDFELGAESYNGITPLVDRDYFPNVKDAIDGASERLFLLLYAFKLSDYDDSLQNRLFDAIVNASRRGVDVRVCLEYSDWEDYINEMNQYTINKFKLQGVNAFFDDEWQITHSKLIVVDDATILGSTNWAYNALNFHHNADVIIDDRRFTADMVEFYADLWGVEGAAPGEVTVSIKTSRDAVTAGDTLDVSGYVTLDRGRYREANISCRVEDASGKKITDDINGICDEDGEFFFSVVMPDESGDFIVRAKVVHNGTSVSGTRSVRIEQRESAGEGFFLSGNLRILVIVGIFVLATVLLLLMLLKKRGAN